mmetsp:Transcript_31381/g.73216  ORF Transcript_31381/g.73216 Transcript_31381/m.73216 type:complete len:393 (+) Transcript_31381:139-1317(+)
MQRPLLLGLRWALVFTHLFTTAGLQSNGYYSAAVQQDPTASSGQVTTSTGKYLIASFPDLKQVAYCALPDSVWRPLVIGDIVSPKALAVDSGHNRLFVADSATSRVYYYEMYRRDGSGLLFTTGVQNVALWGYDVYWMSTNGDGDLYFTGKEVVSPPESTYDAVFRLDYASVKGGNGKPTEIYTRSNSGAPTPAVWMPGGVGVDSFYVYWTNQEEGLTAGSVSKGPRLNIGSTNRLEAVSSVVSNTAENRGMALTSSFIYWLATDGVYGISKGTAGGSLNPNEGKIADPPGADPANAVWDPRSIAFDGEGTLFLTDNLAGKVYTLSGTSTFPHALTKFVDAPGVHGVAVLQIWASASSDLLEATRGGAAARHPYLAFVLLMCWVRALGLGCQ